MKRIVLLIISIFIISLAGAETINLEQTVTGDTTVLLNIANVTSVRITGEHTGTQSNATLITNQGEYRIAGLIGTVNFDDVCAQSCELEPQNAQAIRLEVSGSLRIDEIIYEQANQTQDTGNQTNQSRTQTNVTQEATNSTQQENLTEENTAQENNTVAQASFSTQADTSFPTPWFIITADSSLVSNANTNLYYDLSLAPIEFWTAMGASEGSVQAIGGETSVINDGGTYYRVHKFESDGTLEVIQGGSMEYLIVAGGGGGGRSDDNQGGGAGGGAGGLLEGTTTVTTGSKTVIVGTGGRGGYNATYKRGFNGENSSFNGIEARGGGGGGAEDGGPTAGLDGGSGGGGTNGDTGGSGTTGQGNDGGTGDYAVDDYHGGGGGGAGSAGGLSLNGRSPGAGLSRDITGTSITYATGGRGGDSQAPTGTDGADGTDGLGEGGGGAYGNDVGEPNNLGGDGGDGVVIVRYEVDEATVANDGGSIRVYNVDTQEQLAREVVGFNTTALTGDLYFNSKDLSTSADTRYLIHFGDGSLSEPAASSTYGKHNVWTDYEAVYHLDESPSGSSISDSTANGYDLTPDSTMTDDDLVDGILGKAIDFDGADDWLNYATTSFLSGESAFSISMKIQADTVVDEPFYTLDSGSYGSGSDDFTGARNDIAGFSGGGTDVYKSTVDTSTGLSQGETSSNSATTDWTDITIGWSSGSAQNMYIDGSAVTWSASPVSRTGTLIMNVLAIGRGNKDQWWDGRIDEVRVSTTEKSSSYVQTEYNNQNDPATFWSTGEFRNGTTKVGGPTNWQWETIQPDHNVPVGGPTSWTWQDAEVAGDQIRGPPTSWNWETAS